MKKLLDMIDEDWKLYASSGPELALLNRYAHFGRKVTIYYAGMAFLLTRLISEVT